MDPIVKQWDDGGESFPSSTKAAAWFPIGVLAVRFRPNGAGWRALRPCRERKKRMGSGKVSRPPGIRFPMAKRSCAFLVSAWLSVGCGAQLRRIRDASLENLHAGPRAASKGLQLPGNAEKSVTLSRLPHDTGPHHHERTVRPRPRIGGNAAECKCGEVERG